MNAMKRQRLDFGLDNAAEASAEPQLTPPPEQEVGLPAELWARVLQFAYFDEVLAFTAISKFFLDHVPQHTEKLWIRSGESMDVAPAVIERFSGVQYVDIYLIRKLAEDVDVQHLDCVALQNAVPFLSRLPKLMQCEVGYRDGQYVRAYDIRDENNYDQSNPNSKWAAFIQSICKGYRTGKLSQHVKFDGLLPIDHPYPGCAWRNIPKIGSYRDDVTCQLCDMICTSFPPDQVLEMDNDLIPCVAFENMVKIVRCRNEDESQSIMTAALRYELTLSQFRDLMCPPDYVTKTCDALEFLDYALDRIECFVLNGANPKDPSILHFLLDKENRWCKGKDCFIGRKRIIVLETYMRLKALGFDLSENDFVTVDESDKRTSVDYFEANQIKCQLNSGVALSSIKKVQDQIRSFVVGSGIVVSQGWYMGHSQLKLNDTIDMLEQWLEMDLSDHNDDIYPFFMECMSENTESK